MYMQVNDDFHERRFVAGSRRSRSCLKNNFFKKNKRISKLTKLMFTSIPLLMNTSHVSRNYVWTEPAPSMMNNIESINTGIETESDETESVNTGIDTASDDTVVEVTESEEDIKIFTASMMNNTESIIIPIPIPHPTPKHQTLINQFFHPDPEPNPDPPPNPNPNPKHQTLITHFFHPNPKPNPDSHPNPNPNPKTRNHQSNRQILM